MDKKLQDEINYAKTKEGQRELRNQIENDTCLRDEKKISTPQSNDGSPYWNWVDRKLNKGEGFSQELPIANPDFLAESDGIWTSKHTHDVRLDKTLHKMDSLSLHEKRVLMLMAEEGLTPQEVADRLNASKKSIEKTIERFRKKLGDK